MAKAKRSKKKTIQCNKKKTKSRSKTKKIARPINKRAKAKLPGLNKNLFSRIKQEYFDLDYIDSLTKKQKIWLNKFMVEYLGANLKENDKPLHKTKKMRKSCFDMNNSRNRDIMSIKKAIGDLNYITDNGFIEAQQEDDPFLFEDAFIDLLDKKRALEDME